ncbi:MAG: L,D-transpeptidase family protein [Planctomycetota bacterium]
MIYFLLVLALFFGLKIFMRKPAPAPTFATSEQMNLPLPEITQQSTEIQTIDEVTSPQPFDLPQTSTTSAKENRTLNDLLEKVEVSLGEEPQKIIDARDQLNEMLTVPMSDKQQRLIKQQLTAISNEWLFSRQVHASDTLCELYEVQVGDMFRKIAKKCKVPHEFLMKINNISDPRSLRAGETIKIVNGPFNCRINRSTFTLDLYLQDTYVRSFVVGLGRPSHETPTGCWLVKYDGKLIQPTWTDPETGKTYQAHDPDYPLGARWIGLEGIDGQAKGRTGFAIHGTKNPEEIGKAVSRGCIRLDNKDVILMYDLLMPGSSQVLVND